MKKRLRFQFLKKKKKANERPLPSFQLMMWAHSHTILKHSFDRYFTPCVLTYEIRLKRAISFVRSFEISFVLPFPSNSSRNRRVTNGSLFVCLSIVKEKKPKKTTVSQHMIHKAQHKHTHANSIRIQMSMLHKRFTHLYICIININVYPLKL